ncbi:MAG: biopolymer transporter ExbD [Myxococcota bacterium]|nr:biopolymer transporter ExbD [Myxococcota bacterium]
MAHLDTGGTGTSRNVELNVVPFIDLMSCLTAFLLVTAVWVNTAQLPMQPAGQAREGDECDRDPACLAPKLSVLVEADVIWIGVSRVNDFEQIPKLATGHDWAKLEERLKVHKASAFFVDQTAIEIAAASTAATPIAYQTLIATMDVAVKAGFANVGITEPASLSARPHL